MTILSTQLPTAKQQNTTFPDLDALQEAGPFSPRTRATSPTTSQSLQFIPMFVVEPKRPLGRGTGGFTNQPPSAAYHSISLIPNTFLRRGASATNHDALSDFTSGHSLRSPFCVTALSQYQRSLHRTNDSDWREFLSIVIEVVQIGSPCRYSTTRMRHMSSKKADSQWRYITGCRAVDI